MSFFPVLLISAIIDCCCCLHMLHLNVDTRVHYRKSSHSSVCPLPPLLFHSPCHPKPHFVLRRPWQCSQSSSKHDIIGAECVRMIFFFLQQCLLCSNGLCVSGPGVGIILETGSWQSPGVDFWGEDGIRFIPISLVINQKGQLVVVAGEMFCKWYILQVRWERCSFQFHDLHKCLSNYLASN